MTTSVGSIRTANVNEPRRAKPAAAANAWTQDLAPAYYDPMLGSSRDVAALLGTAAGHPLAAAPRECFAGSVRGVRGAASPAVDCRLQDDAYRRISEHTDTALRPFGATEA
jgi:hypothetical protein